jgi:hypothetical protein
MKLVCVELVGRHRSGTQSNLAHRVGCSFGVLDVTNRLIYSCGIAWIFTLAAFLCPFICSVNMRLDFLFPTTVRVDLLLFVTPLLSWVLVNAFLATAVHNGVSSRYLLTFSFVFQFVMILLFLVRDLNYTKNSVRWVAGSAALSLLLLLPPPYGSSLVG